MSQIPPRNTHKWKAKSNRWKQGCNTKANESLRQLLIYSSVPNWTTLTCMHNQLYLR